MYHVNDTENKKEISEVLETPQYRKKKPGVLETPQF
jgi:hypothetical protein